MLGLVLGSSLIIILSYLWYAGLVRKRQLALEALGTINDKLAQRTTLVHEYADSLKSQREHQQEQQALLAKLDALQASYQWQPDASNIASFLESWLSVDILLTELVASFNHLDPNDSWLESYTELKENCLTAQRFYNHAVDELNLGVTSFPGSIIANLTHIKVMPCFQQELASHSED
ncbi:LemA family protein [Shewanella sp.]|uniref:LemA family protein n=1 Tax=Shewanella sp. TaxID=50422 RepID=UPI004053A1DE